MVFVLSERNSDTLRANTTSSWSSAGRTVRQSHSHLPMSEKVEASHFAHLRNFTRISVQRVVPSLPAEARAAASSEEAER